MSESIYGSLPELQLRLPNADVAFTAAESVVHTAAMEAVSRAIDGWCGRVFYPRTQTRVYTADAFGCLAIDDLVSVTTLKTDDNADGTYETTWATTDYVLTPANAPYEIPAWPYTRIEASRLTTSAGRVFPVRVQSGVQVVGVFGWPDVPAAIREVCLIESLRLSQQFGAPSGVVSSEALGQWIVAPKMLPASQLMLAPYRRFGLAVASGSASYA